MPAVNNSRGISSLIDQIQSQIHAKLEIDIATKEKEEKELLIEAIIANSGSNPDHNAGAEKQMESLIHATDKQIQNDRSLEQCVTAIQDNPGEWDANTLNLLESISESLRSDR